MAESRIWSDVRYAAIVDNNADVKKVASFVRTYLALLNIRIRHLSVAYNQALSFAYDSNVQIDNLHSNAYTDHITQQCMVFWQMRGP